MAERSLPGMGRCPLLLDGGLGTMLIQAGLPAGRPPEAWVFERPEALSAVHRAYADAGADVLHAATFGGSPPRMAEFACLTGRCAELARAAVALARAAAGPGVLVAGDVGPTGLMLPPMGTADLSRIRDALAEQADALVAAGADLLSIETMYDLREAREAVLAAAATGLPVLACMTFDVKRRGAFTVMGDPLVPSLRSLAEAGAGAVGFNCTLASGPMLRLVEEARAAVDLPLIAQPNAGQPRPTAGGVVYDAAAEDFAADLGRMLDAGVDVVGGCCGTTPGFIRAARTLLDSR